MLKNISNALRRTHRNLQAIEPTTLEMLSTPKNYRDSHYETELRTTVEMPVVTDEELAAFSPQRR